MKQPSFAVRSRFLRGFVPRSSSVFGFIVWLCCIHSSLASDRAEARYSFSLTTFDPSGKLGQVEHALQAAAQGTPVVGLVRASGMFLAAPKILPSLLIADDGTSRFSQVTKEILVAHSGLSADGRVLCAEAQRMAVEHEYTFDEDIPIDIFLEEISLLFQEYTMKAAARPFGSALIVAYMPYLPSTRPPCFYRVDPSGTVTALGKCAIVNGNLERTHLGKQAPNLVEDSSSQSADAATVESDHKAIASLLRTALEELTSKKTHDSSLPLETMTILTACLPGKGKFSQRQHDTKP